MGQDYDHGSITDVLDGYIFEILIYDHWLPNREREALDRFLVRKFKQPR